MHLSLSAGGVSAETIGDMLDEQAKNQLTSQGLAEQGVGIRNAIRSFVDDALSDLAGSASVSVALTINISRTQMPARSPDVG